MNDKPYDWNNEGRSYQSYLNNKYGGKSQYETFWDIITHGLDEATYNRLRRRGMHLLLNPFGPTELS